MLITTPHIFIIMKKWTSQGGGMQTESFFKLTNK